VEPHNHQPSVTTIEPTSLSQAIEQIRLATQTFDVAREQVQQALLFIENYTEVRE
jgi:hypothetical protein